MIITSRTPQAMVATASVITAKKIGESGGGSDCPLTFENGILNANRVLCSGQVLLGASADNLAYGGDNIVYNGDNVTA